MKKQTQCLLAFLAVLPSTAVFACASDGCSLSSDVDVEWLSSSNGFRFDLRYDYLNQNQIRSGTGTPAVFPVDGHEQELYTKSQTVTAGFDYRWNAYWSVNVQVPYLDRAHGTNGFAFDGTDAGTSHTKSIGDIKVIGSYMGLSDEHNLGVQFGLKLPTGSYTQNFDGGPIAGQPLDRGLQPGTGTTDAIVGAFRFSPLSQNWNYFTQAIVQIPLNSRADYKPGKALNLNAGLRYLGFDKVVPQVQLNVKFLGKDSGANAAPDDSGGTTVYLSPGFTAPLTEKVKVYGSVQLPIYRKLNGFQLAAKYIFSVGTRVEF
ncbi:hypothetical protein [Polaromonas jejuensis]|uniref:TonB-dependent receptor n=1 Tax=Polaromonas jejuensis TaxID=457502 RepID=A0ABW0Q717_9BURK|nr:hypothetical protein [Polaromonas jejuensis]